MPGRKYLGFLIVAVLMIGCGRAKPKLDNIFDGFRGTIVVYDQQHDMYTRWNDQRAMQRFSPCSTFKIPNALIALEAGVIPNSDYVIDWDSAKYPRQEWWSDNLWSTMAKPHNLKSAIKYSVVWYFQELAKRIGKERYKKYLSIMNYGNRDISGELTEFWLMSSLKISAHEQVEFLKRFYHNRFGFKKENIRQVKEAIVLEENDRYRLSGKTGLGISDDQTIGWLVGYLEQGENVYFYAMNIESDDYEMVRSSRMNIVKDVFREMGVIPGEQFDER